MLEDPWYGATGGCMDSWGAIGTEGGSTARQRRCVLLRPPAGQLMFW